jgi:hypothetical protein
MALAVTHATVVATPDDGTSDVGSDEWNEAHTLTGQVSPAQGGTGVANNASSTITVSGSFPLTLTLSASTGVTLPTSGTLVSSASTLAVFAATTSAQLAGVISNETGTGVLVFNDTPTLIAPILGTPTSGTLTNCTLPVGGISGLGSNVATFLATPSSANLISAVTDETGTGALVFANTPTLVTPVLGAATGTSVVLSGKLEAASIELGHASANTLTASGGALSIEGVAIPTISSTDALSNKTLTAAKIASGGFLADANGNELIIFTTTASAVNELTYANGSTGVNPKWTASGETNVGMDFQGKGTGTYRFLGTADQAAQIRLYEDTDAGSNYTAFRVGTQAGDLTYTLPTALGSAGEVLTDVAGDGVLSWESGGGGLTVGTTTITSGTDTRILYNNAGTLGEYTLTGTGTVVAMQTAPTFATSITTPSVLATADDSGALGASGTAFADLFLASGGVINWNAGNFTLTHSAGLLTANGAITGTTLTGTTGLAAGVASTTTGTVTIYTSGSATAGAILTTDAVSTLALRNGTNPQAFNVYATESSSLTNYERIELKYSAVNTRFELQTTKAGTGARRAIVIQNYMETGGGQVVLNCPSSSANVVTFGRADSATDWVLNSSGNFTPSGDNSKDFGTSILRTKDIYSSGSTYQGGTATTFAGRQHTLVVRKTGIADATATAIITVTVPNAAHNAAIFLDILGHLGTGTDASESSRTATGSVVIARTAGVDTVAVVSTLEAAQIATVAGGGTLTLAYDLSALTGASSATQTFTIRLTLTVTGTITDHTAVVSARLLNSLATGVTMAAA